MEYKREAIIYNKKISITIVLMLISMYLPYQRSLSYLYQISVFGIIVLLCGTTSYALLPIIVLATTRSYIAVSTQAEFLNYYGLNGEILLIIMALLLCLVLKNHDFKIRVRYGVGSLCLIGLLMLFSQTWASNTLEYGSYFNPICLMYITVPMLIESEEDIAISKLAFTIAGFFAGLGIIPHLLNLGTIYEFSVSVDRNYQSCFLLICVLQTVTLLATRWNDWKTLQKILCFTVIVMDIYIIITSASRSAFIALGIAIAIYMLSNLKHHRKFLSYLVVGGVIIAYLYEMGIFDFILERFQLSNAKTGNGRTDIWIDYLNGFVNGNIFEILFGHGLTGQTPFKFAAHNIFVSFLYSFGIIGLMLLIETITSCIVSYIRNGEKLELVSLIPILFMCCTIEPYYRIEFAIYLGTMVGYSNYYESRRISEYE